MMTEAKKCEKIKKQVPGPHYDIGDDTSHLSDQRHYRGCESPRPSDMVRGLGEYPTKYTKGK